MTTVMPPPRFTPEERGLRAALNYVKTIDQPTSGGGVKGTDNEVKAAFARLDEFMPDGKQASTKASLTVALQLLQKDLTQSAIDAVFERFGIDRPEEPVVDDPGIVRPRYGLMETARPIIDRVNGGSRSEEDVARLELLRAIADRATAGDARPRTRGRMFMPLGAVRSADASGMAEVRAAINDALSKTGA